MPKKNSLGKYKVPNPGWINIWAQGLPGLWIECLVRHAVIKNGQPKIKISRSVLSRKEGRKGGDVFGFFCLKSEKKGRLKSIDNPSHWMPL